MLIGIKRAFAHPKNEKYLSLLPKFAVIFHVFYHDRPELWIRPVTFLLARLYASIKSGRYNYKSDFIKSFQEDMYHVFIPDLVKLAGNDFFAKHVELMEEISRLSRPYEFQTLLWIFSLVFSRKEAVKMLAHSLKKQTYSSNRIDFCLSLIKETKMTSLSEFASFLALQIAKNLSAEKATKKIENLYQRKFISSTLHTVLIHYTTLEK